MHLRYSILNWNIFQTLILNVRDCLLFYMNIFSTLVHVINYLLWTVISSRCVYNALYHLFLSSICNSCLLLCFFQTPTNVHRTMAVAPKDVSTLTEATDVNVLTAINWTAEICILVSVSTRCEVTTTVGF